jgi:hypothetical protein
MGKRSLKTPLKSKGYDNIEESIEKSVKEGPPDG